MTRLPKPTPDERAYPERDLAILEMLYGCGVRVSELVALDIDDIDWTEGWMRVSGKGKKERQVPMTERAAAVLRDYHGQTPDASGRERPFPESSWPAAHGCQCS